jgi:hypothetical protein
VNSPAGPIREGIATETWWVSLCHNTPFKVPSARKDPIGIR